MIHLIFNFQDYVLSEESIRIEVEKEELVQKWMSNSVTQTFLDCEFEMRFDDWHQIRQVQFSHHLQLVFVYVLLIEKFREEKKDHFILIFGNEGIY